MDLLNKEILKISTPIVYKPPTIANNPGKTLGGGLCNLVIDS